MKISEIFYSIIGEARGIGEPAIFVRLSGCNLACSWCDTKYALGKDYKEISVEKVVDEVKQYNCKNIVITGGEPMLQIGPLTYFVFLLYNDGYKITIETNGTMKPSLSLCNMVTQWNISPKFGNIKYDVLTYFYSQCYGYSDFILKFVIESSEQIKEIKRLQEILPEYSNDKIYLMPCSQTRIEYLANAGMLIELCKKYGYNFSPREHIVIWDNKRGV